MSFDGFLAIDKPAGMTSRDAVNRALGWFPRRTRIGHAGTLDPLATGMLVLGIGKGTRLVEYVQRMPKTYRSTFVFGATSDTDDADGTITPWDRPQPITASLLQQALPAFVGEIEQVPPAYSAMKVDGQRAHDLARRGHDVALRPRLVRIDRIELLKTDEMEIDVEIVCGKGTYIRSIARDLGRVLQCGAYVKTLRRTCIGPFHTDHPQTITLDASRETAHTMLQPLSVAVTQMSRWAVDDSQAGKLYDGTPIPCPLQSGEVVAFHQDLLLAIGHVQERIFYPDKVFAD